MKYFAFIFVLSLTYSCKDVSDTRFEENEPYLLVLGIAQDGGYPQAGCKKSCCNSIGDKSNKREFVSSVAIIDPLSNERWIIDATPDFRDQLNLLDMKSGSSGELNINGIFLTHAHIGHYCGLIHLGREVLGTDSLPVYAMSRMLSFLENNGPWSQLVSLKNISLKPLIADSSLKLNSRLSITPFIVPHRDEYSETVGYKIEGPGRIIIYIPDIDKWEKWEQNILKIVQESDIVFLDGTFYDNSELPGRDMSKIPHPFITESLVHFRNLSKEDRNKIYFLHLNHTNLLFQKGSMQYRTVIEAGYNVASGLQVENL